MKKHHTTIILLTLFFTGLIVLWWADYAGIPTSQELEASRDLVLSELRTVSPDGINRLEIVRPAEEGPAKGKPSSRVVFERRDDGWQMVDPVDAAADSSRVQTLVQNLKHLRKSAEAGTIHDPAARFGLDPAAATVKVYGSSSGTPLAALEIGRSVRDRLYVRTAGKPGIEVVDSRLFQGINDPAPAWREKSIFSLATFQVAGLKVTGPGRDLKAERLEGHWRLLRPIRALGDDLKMEDVLGELTSLRVADGADGFVADDVRDLAPYGLDKDHAVTVEILPVLSRARPQVLLVGNPAPDKGGLVYAMRSGQNDVVLIDGKGFRDLGVSANTLRSNNVADFEPARVDFLRVESSGRTFDLSRSAAGWNLIRPTRGRADEESVSQLLSTLRQLQSSEFLDERNVAKPELKPSSLTLKLWQLGPRGRIPAEAAEKPAGDLAVDLHLGRHDVLKKTVYARVEGDPTVLALPDSFLQVLPRNELAFRRREMLDLGPGQVARLTIERDGRKFVLAPAASGTPNQWRMEEPVEAQADGEAVTKALLGLSPLRADSLITDHPGDDSKYGLDSPSLRITWTTQPRPSDKSGSSEPTTGSLKVGSQVAKSGLSYASLAGSPLVFTLNESVLLPFRAEYRNREVVSFPSKQVERLDLRWPGRILSFHQHPTRVGSVSDWDPAPGTDASGFDLSRIGSLAKDLSRLQTRKFVQYSGPLPAASSLDKPRLTVQVYLKGRREPLEVRVGNAFEGDEFYATIARGKEGAVFLVSGPGWADLLKPPGTSRSDDLPADVFAPGPASPPG